MNENKSAFVVIETVQGQMTAEIIKSIFHLRDFQTQKKGQPHTQRDERPAKNTADDCRDIRRFV